MSSSRLPTSDPTVSKWSAETTKIDSSGPSPILEKQSESGYVHRDERGKQQVWKEKSKEKWVGEKTGENDLLDSPKEKAEQLTAEAGQKYEQTKDQIRSTPSSST